MRAHLLLLSKHSENENKRKIVDFNKVSSMEIFFTILLVHFSYIIVCYCVTLLQCRQSHGNY